MKEEQVTMEPFTSLQHSPQGSDIVVLIANYDTKQRDDLYFCWDTMHLTWSVFVWSVD